MIGDVFRELSEHAPRIAPAADRDRAIVQGFEIEVLLGSRETLRNNPGLTVAFEFWPYGLRQTGHQPNELLGLLEEAGFSRFSAAGEAETP